LGGHNRWFDVFILIPQDDDFVDIENWQRQFVLTSHASGCPARKRSPKRRSHFGHLVRFANVSHIATSPVDGKSDFAGVRFGCEFGGSAKRTLFQPNAAGGFAGTIGTILNDGFFFESNQGHIGFVVYIQREDNIMPSGPSGCCWLLKQGYQGLAKIKLFIHIINNGS
jgi:hypothetical protein